MWSLEDDPPTRTYTLKKTDSLGHEFCYGAHEPFLVYSEVSTGLVLYKSCAGNHSNHKFMNEKVLVMARRYSFTPILLWLLPSFQPLLFNNPLNSDVDAPTVGEYSTDTFLCILTSA